MKQRLDYLREAIQVLADRSEAAGDVDFLKRNNNELKAQLRAFEREEVRMREDLDSCERRIRDLKKEMRTLKERLGSRSPSLGTGNAGRVERGNSRGNPRVTKGSGNRQEPANGTRDKRQILSMRDVNDRMEEILEYDTQLSQQISLLEKLREEGRRIIEETQESGSDVPPRQGPRILENVQAAPPLRGTEYQPWARTGPSKPEVDNGSGGWTTVDKRGRRRKGNRTPLRKEDEVRRPADNLVTEPPRSEDRVIAARPRGETRAVERKRNPQRRRSPKTAAVALKATEEGGTYAQILKAARDKVSLKDLGISSPRIRRAINGGIIIEIPGEDGPTKADSLAAKLRETIGGMAQVVRPIAKGELLLIGLDDSVEIEEIISEVAERGGCLRGEIKIGQRRQMRNGLGIIWIQCPMSAVGKLTDIGRLRLGWSLVRVEALKAKPIQCFRCWRTGHVRGLCQSRTDRSGHCFRCGKEGHQSKDCTEPFSCAVCAEDGRESAHRMGARGCINFTSQDRRIRAD